MKNLLRVIVIVSFAVPIKSADFDLYGEIGMGGWWMKTERFYKDTLDTTGGKITWCADSLPITSCNWIPFGNLGIKFKGDRFGGCVELGISVMTNDFIYEYVNPTIEYTLYQKRSFATSMRKWYAEWYINDIFTLLIGKNSAPACFFPSNQAFWGGKGFSNIGCLYTGNHPMFQISIHDPNHIVEGKIAAIRPDTVQIQPPKASSWWNRYQGEARAPKAEGSFEVNIDKDIFSIHFKAGGGYQRFWVVIFEEATLTAKESKFDVDTWVYGGDLGIRLGPVTVAYDIFHGKNIGIYGVPVGEPFQWWRRSYYMHAFFPNYDSKLRSGRVVEMASILNVKPWDFLSFEGGFGTIILEHHDFEQYLDRWHNTYTWYFQVESKILEHLKVTPEVGQSWLGPDIGFGRYTYWGLNTIIDF